MSINRGAIVPELPEVETVARDLRRAGLESRRIAQVGVFWPRTVAAISPRRFKRLLVGRRVQGIGRRGKYLVFELDGGLWILVHLRMTGQFRMDASRDDRDPHEHIILKLDNGQDLRFRDTRKFGRWTVTDRPEAILARLGPEPLDPGFTGRCFADRLGACRRMLKPLLLDQAFIAGIGNIYADEALWEARLHPRRRSDTLSAAEALRLYRSIRNVLRRGIRHMGTTLGSGRANFYSVGGRRGRNQDGLRVFRRTGCPCPRCGQAIERLLVAQRSTHVCRACQAGFGQTKAVARGGRQPVA